MYNKYRKYNVELAAIYKVYTIIDITNIDKYIPKTKQSQQPSEIAKYNL